MAEPEREACSRVLATRKTFDRSSSCLTLSKPHEQEVIDTAPDRRIGAARVQFYAAEIILALVHLHDLGLMYRDLKVRYGTLLFVPCAESTNLSTPEEKPNNNGMRVVEVPLLDLFFSRESVLCPGFRETLDLRHEPSLSGIFLLISSCSVLCAFTPGRPQTHYHVSMSTSFQKAAL